MHLERRIETAVCALLLSSLCVQGLMAEDAADPKVSLRRAHYRFSGKITSEQGYILNGSVGLRTSRPEGENLRSGMLIENWFPQMTRIPTGTVEEGSYTLEIKGSQSPIYKDQVYYLCFFSRQHLRTVLLDVMYFSDEPKTIEKDYRIPNVLPKPITLKLPEGVSAWERAQGEDGRIPIRSRGRDGEGTTGFSTYHDREEAMEIIRTVDAPGYHEAKITFVNKEGNTIRDVYVRRHVYTDSDAVFSNFGESGQDGVARVSYLEPGEAEFQADAAGYRRKTITLPDRETIRMTVELESEK